MSFYFIWGRVFTDGLVDKTGELKEVFGGVVNKKGEFKEVFVV